MPLQITETIAANEKLSSERIDYDKYEAETMEKLLSRVKECDLDNAKELIYHCINDSIIHIEICEIDKCASDAAEIKYFEFNTVEETEKKKTK